MVRLRYGWLMAVCAAGIGGCQGGAAAEDPLGSIRFEGDPSALGQVILSQKSLMETVDARDRLDGDLSTSEQVKIIEYIQSLYVVEAEDVPPAVIYQDGEFIINNLDTDYETAKQLRFSGPRDLGEELWVFDTLTSVDVTRMGAGTIEADFVKLAAPETPAFDAAVKSVDKLDDITQLMDPAILEPLSSGSSGVVKNFKMTANGIRMDFQFVGWKSDAEAQTLSLRVDGARLSYRDTALSFDHLSVTDLHYPAFFAGVERLRRGGLDYLLRQRSVEYLNPFHTPYRSISIQNFELTDQITNLDVKKFNFWGTEEADGTFENHGQIEGFHMKVDPEKAERSVLPNILPFADFGFHNIHLEFKSHARLDRNADRWTETIELVSPELSNLRIDLDVDGYAQIQALAPRSRNSKRPDDKALKVAIENWRIRNFDILWDDNDALAKSLVFMENRYGPVKSRDEILTEFERDLGEYFFGHPDNSVLLALKSDYVRAMSAQLRKDGVLSVTSEPSGSGASMGLLLGRDGKSPEEKQAEFIETMNLEIRHLPKLP